jgi:hypothetical protein
MAAIGSTQHDGNHGAYLPRVGQLAMARPDPLGGSAYFWRQAQYQHHTRMNISGQDDDISLLLVAIAVRSLAYRVSVSNITSDPMGCRAEWQITGEFVPDFEDALRADLGALPMSGEHAMFWSQGQRPWFGVALLAGTPTVCRFAIWSR